MKTKVSNLLCMELKADKNGNPMMAFTTAGIVIAFPLVKDHDVHICNEFLRSFDLGVDVKFESFRQYGELIDTCANMLRTRKNDVKTSTKGAFDYTDLQARITEKFADVEALAAVLDMDMNVLNDTLENKVEFECGDMCKIVDALDIEPCEIEKFFFTLQSEQHDVTDEMLARVAALDDVMRGAQTMACEFVQQFNTQPLLSFVGDEESQDDRFWHLVVNAITYGLDQGLRAHNKDHD